MLAGAADPGAVGREVPGAGGTGPVPLVGEGCELLGVSPSFSNILDDLLKLLFCVHVEFHPRLHRGKLDVGGI